MQLDGGREADLKLRPSPSPSRPPGWSGPARGSNDLVVVIERRSLVRDCLACCLGNSPGWTAQAFGSIEDWLAADCATEASLIILSLPGGNLRQLETLVGQPAAPLPVPVMVMSETDDPDHIIDALSKGARGFLPSDTSLEIAIEAMNLVRAGGVFVPAISLLASRRRPAPLPPTAQAARSPFTARQIAVIKALRQGKANKTIAYELNMCESTVKVHIRNVMKKLNAKNRTQVAFMAGSLLDAEGGA